MSDKVQLIPIDQIRILNPRHREKKRFELMLESIRALGLKKPIQVSLRSKDEAAGLGYDLVCGQGRMEAFQALGHREIPAIVVEISKEERMLRSLVENMARRHTSSLDLIREIERLKEQGYSQADIGRKLDLTNGTLYGLLSLSKAGEERLLEAALSGRIPIWVAIDIAKTDTVETQRELLKAFETKQLNHVAILKIKRLMENRRFFGKQRGSAGARTYRTKTSAEGLVAAYRRESQRQRHLVHKAKICDARLLFVRTAFRKLMDDPNFVTLLRGESLGSMPKGLWENLHEPQEEAA